MPHASFRSKRFAERRFSTCRYASGRDRGLKLHGQVLHLPVSAVVKNVDEYLLTGAYFGEEAQSWGHETCEPGWTLRKQSSIS